jgi:hypothetical protein
MTLSMHGVRLRNSTLAPSATRRTPTVANPARHAVTPLAALFTSALLILAPPAHAGEKTRDLGPIPTSGVDAAKTLPDRQKRVIRELACGSESTFMDQTRAGPKDRPLGIITAKAAVLAGLLDPQVLQCEITQVFAGEDWNASIDYIIDANAKTEYQMGVPVTLVDASYDALKDAIDALNNDLNNSAQPPAPSRATENADEIKRLLNKLEFDTFGPACDSTVPTVTAIVHPKTAAAPGVVEYRVTYSLSASCLEGQINYVILARDLVRTGNPGSDGLPCHLFGTAPEGDWDMAVAQLTRLTFLLRKAGTLRTMSAESTDAMDKLQTRLLTLSGGAAEEVHEIWQCGNPDNQYGSARDRLDDEDFYDPDLGKTVEGDAEGSDFWDDFWDVLAFAFLLLLIGLTFGAIFAALAAMFGPLIAAIVMAVLVALSFLADVPQLIAGALFGGVEETENHLFMQNSAKYLKNQMLIEEASALGDDDAVEDYEDFNEGIHEWFMERLQGVVENDFAEFNAKPYGRLSFTALLNVHDFSCSAGVPSCTDDDTHLVQAVAAVGDLTSAKMALGSNQGRRIVPFRRLSHTNTNFTIGKLKDDGTRESVSRLFDLSGGADHQIAAMQVWSGQTFHGHEGRASQASLGEMGWEATSSYAPHRIILDVALDKSVGWEQTFHHVGWERYSSGPAWLITAGGTESGYAQGFRTPLGTIYPTNFIKWGDRGSGVPTTLIVSTGKRLPACEPTNTCVGLPPPRLEQPRRQDMFADFIRFEGKVVHWDKDGNDEPMSFNDNFCVEGSFACGINMQIPPFLDKCLTMYSGASIPSSRTFSIIDSSACTDWDDGDPDNDFFVVIYKQPCNGGGDCKTGSSWGFIEVVTRGAAPTVAALQTQILGGNAGNFDTMGSTSGKGTFTYASLANGVIKFDPHGSYVTEVSGVAKPHGSSPDWPRASGDVVNRTGKGRYTIQHPRASEKIEIDFSDEKEPKRVLPP